MKKFNSWLFIALFTLITFSLSAQKGLKDSSIFIPALIFNYSYQMPLSGAIEESYGTNNSVGAEFSFKLKNNFMIGLNFGYMFGENLKNYNSYFSKITNSNGFVIDGNGQYTEVFLYQRGYNFQLTTGYQFSFWSPNPNSGIFIQAGAGFMEYKTRIENEGKTANAINGEYAKMYDRLRNGFMTSQMVGYRYMSKKNLTNFYGAVELSQAFTNNRRNYNADLTPEQQGKKIDLLISVKLGWIIPFYGREPKDYYYY